MLEDNLQRYLMTSGNETCCWTGISPGITAKSETVEILTRLYGAQNVSVSDTPVIWVSWKSNGADFSRDGSVQISNDKVYEIRVSVSDGKLKVEDLIKSLGEPYFVNLIISGIKKSCSGASLSYPPIGLDATLNWVGKSVGIRNNQFINGFKISPAWTPKDKEWFQILWPDSIKIRWDGYRDYCPKSYSP